MARHADLVFPATTSFERNDIGAGRADARIIAMHRVVEPVGEARERPRHPRRAGRAPRRRRRPSPRVATSAAGSSTSTPKLRAALARRRRRGAVVRRVLGARARSRSRTSKPSACSSTPSAPIPRRNPLRTPSGKIELFSETVAGFGYDDCPGHPTWLESEEWLGSPRAQRFPLALVANNPATRLHGQLDLGAYSQAAKVQGREPVRMHPTDAAARGIADGDVVRLFNDRGSCLAGAVVTTDVRAGVVQLSTGAWFDPDDPSADIAMCVHGNPNVLTRDVGTSRLAQGCSGQHALVEVERFDGALPPVRAFEPPRIAERSAHDGDAPDATAPTGRWSVAFVRDGWHAIARGDELAGAPIARTIFDLPLVLFRDRDGRAAALLDRCAHRNAPLSLGAVDACGPHRVSLSRLALRRARDVPRGARPAERGRSAAGRSVPAFATARAGRLPLDLGPAGRRSPSGSPMRIPHIDDPDYLTVLREYDVECTMHAALENALDVPHTAFVHRGDFRGKESREIEAVRRRIPGGIEVEYIGEPPLSGATTDASGAPIVSQHWDRFFLPGIAQVEYRTSSGRHQISTLPHTPVSALRTRFWLVSCWKVPAARRAEMRPDHREAARHDPRSGRRDPAPADAPDPRARRRVVPLDAARPDGTRDPAHAALRGAGNADRRSSDRPRRSACGCSRGDSMKASVCLLLLGLASSAGAAEEVGAPPAVGSDAPGFELQDQIGTWHTKGRYAGKWLVLYFYPKDGTPGCTKEVCAFRDSITRVRQAGAEVVGVSLDDVASHKEFAEKHRVPFPLLADVDKSTARAYGVLTSKLGFSYARRDTFLIDPQGKIARHYPNVDPEKNVSQVLADLAQLGAAPTARP